MKYKYLFPAIVACILFPECAPRYKVTYNIPEALPDAQRKILVDVLDKGKELYKANCADCHGVFTKGKDKIPNFTNEQIDNYSSRFIMRDMKNHAVARQMSPEQLKQVLTFLKYKRPKNPDSVVAPRRRF
jgi:mono/diheme cytochrome c family protein